jgi:hypothetical protein
MKIERGSIRSPHVENSVWKRLWTCRKTDCVVNGWETHQTRMCTLREQNTEFRNVTTGGAHSYHLASKGSYGTLERIGIALTLQNWIREVSASAVGWNGYRVWVFLRGFSVPPDKFPDATSIRRWPLYSECWPIHHSSPCLPVLYIPS